MNRIIAILNFIFGLITLNTFVNLSGDEFLWLQTFSNQALWFVGPLMYVFIMYRDTSTPTGVYYVHFVPFGIIAILGFLLAETIFDNVIRFLGFAQIMTYMSLSIRLMLKEFDRARSFYRWILPTIITFTAILSINVIIQVFSELNIQILPNPIIQSFTTLLSIPIFFMAFKEMNSSNDFDLEEKKYKTSHLSEQDLSYYVTKIEGAMNSDRYFLESDLTLNKLSSYINIPQKYISQAINQVLEVNFNEYVLSFRLRYVKKALIDSKNKHKTIVAIAEESGFASPSRFNYQFKKHTGKTPSEYQKEGYLT